MLARSQLLPTFRQTNRLNGPSVTQVRTAFYNKYQHGPNVINNPKPDYIKWLKSFFGKEGWEFVKSEPVRIKNKYLSNRFQDMYESNRIYKFEDFDSDESIKKWKPVADSDSLNGFSTSTMVRSPAGHGLFKGVLDNRVPDDGATMKSGFAGVVGPLRPRDNVMSVEEFWDWTNFNTLDIRCRGDGRKYSLVVNTATYTSDLQYYDNYTFPLFTKGGPHWQTFHIPFSKFVFAYKSFVQDKQPGLHATAHKIKCVALTLEDLVDGPFALEVDYIGLSARDKDFEEFTAYETYTFPHLKYTSIQVECDPPDSTPR